MILRLLVICCLSTVVSAANSGAISIGLDADLGADGAEVGAAIRQGCELALAEINAAGGVLGRPLRLLARDHRGNPARGKDNLLELLTVPDLVAVIGGAHTPVALAELGIVHEHRLPLIIPWAAGTAIVDNGYQPNYAFRISARDAITAPILVAHAQQQGLQRVGLLLEQTGWGRSNEVALTAALSTRGLQLAAVRYFGRGTPSLQREVDALLAAGSQTIIVVSGTSEGALALAAVHALPPARRVPVISHWGITVGGHSAAQRVAPYLADGVELVFPQTVILGPAATRPQQRQLWQRLTTQDPSLATNGVAGAPGLAHAYDAVQLLAQAIAQAGSCNRSAIRDALEQLPPWEGVVRRYAPAFTASDHEALTPADLIMARYDAHGRIVPATSP